MGEKQYPEEGQLEICPSENTQYYTEIGDQVIEKQIVIQVQSAGAPQQPQPAQPQPQAPKSNPVKLDFSFPVSWAWPGDEVTILLNQILNVDIYAGGILANKTVSKDNKKEISFIASPAMKEDYFKVRGNGQVARKEFTFVSEKNSPKSTDLAVTDLFADNMPKGRIFAQLTNRGPVDIANTWVELTCNATLKPISGSTSGWDAFINNQVKLFLSLYHNETIAFDTDIENNSDQFSYLMECKVFPTDGTYKMGIFGRAHPLEESNSNNNTYKEDMPFFFNQN